MLCENCNSKPATLHFTKVVNGQKNEFHLCESCAHEKGEMINPDSDFNFHHLLSGLLNFDQVLKGNQIKTNPETIRCDKCGLTFPQFKRMGKFGCSNCYTSFENQLEPIFRRVHGNSTHIGKVPVRSGKKIQLKKEISMLKQELQNVIANEEFEKAAELRDKIKELEKNLS